MKTPSRLEDWSLEAIEALVRLGVSENQDFEFKSALVLRDNQGIATLSKQVAAFANGRGGFLVLGVSEGNPRAVEGVRVDGELAKKLNDRIQVYPAVSYPPPLVIPVRDSLSVVVVEIPASNEGPHASTAEKVPQFYVRTHSGAEPMNWVAIRDGMIRADERRRQVEVLLGEFELHYSTWRAHLVATRESHHYPETQTFDLSMTRLALAAVHPWLSKDPHAWPDVSRLVSRMNHINGQVQAMVASVAVHPERVSEWRGRMAVVLGGFRDQLVSTDAGVRRVFGLPSVVDYQTKFPEY